MGFIVDTFLVYSFVYAANPSPIWSRFPSWIIAVLVTYAFDLLCTFGKLTLIIAKKRHKVRRYCLYVSSQAVGGAMNIATYLALVSLFKSSIALAMISGTLIGLFLSYLGGQLWLICAV